MARYLYNGLGHRVGKQIQAEQPREETIQTMHLDTIVANLDPVKQLQAENFAPTSKIDYTIDLTRQYHNLLQKEEENHMQTYLWNGNVAGMVDGINAMNSQYYFQDELGSPIRLADGEGNLKDTYGYDEFGQDLYQKQGVTQPFGYTGYQLDDVAGTYFAQAREYQSGVGRFAGEDIIKGMIAVPQTMNSYGYCWGRPMTLIDLNGEKPEKKYVYEKRNNFNGIALVWNDEHTQGTIVAGNNASLADAYAVISLDVMRDKDVDSSTVQQFVNRYRSNNQETTIVEGKDISYYDTQPDITKSLIYEMIKNEYESNAGGYDRFPWIGRLPEFKENVQNRGPWDLKQNPAWSSSSAYIFNRELVDKDAPGNIMYGYMGKAYGIPDSILYLAASYAQLAAGTSNLQFLIATLGDDPLDQLNIKRGIQCYNKYHLGENCNE
ncbi:MAG: polymorphic toxin type 44 domain-containing protein [Lachnospiraceae bacterium]